MIFVVKVHFDKGRHGLITSCLTEDVILKFRMHYVP